MSQLEQQISTLTETVHLLVDEVLRLKDDIKNMTVDKEVSRIAALQEQYLRKKTLTVKEIKESQLLGNVTTRTIRNKLKHDKGFYQDGKIWKMVTSSLIQYRETHGLI